MVSIPIRRERVVPCGRLGASARDVLDAVDMLGAGAVDKAGVGRIGARHVPVLPAVPVRQVRAGRLVKLAGSPNVRITRAARSQFSGEVDGPVRNHRGSDNSTVVADPARTWGTRLGRLGAPLLPQPAGPRQDRFH